MIPTIHGFSPPGEAQLKKEVLGGSSCSDKLREPREPGPGRPEKLGETEVPATASTSNGAGPGPTENIKRKSRLEGGEREPNLCLGAELASYDEVKVWTEEGEEESEMTCSERLQAELQDDPGGGPPLIPVDPPDPPSSPREQELAGKSEPSGSPYTPPGFLGLPYPGYPHTPHISRGGSPLSPIKIINY